jgi:carbon-monoxide dehydrogenase small subunit
MEVLSVEAITDEKIVKLKVNGNEHCLRIFANEILSDVLREKLSLTGTKIGCNGGECGACTVLIDGEPIVSCLALAIEYEGREILTIEGLADPASRELHPIQEAFVENAGLQCGFCTPGMIMSAKSLLDKNLNPTEKEIKAAINGNICRCTGYESIVKSISVAAKKMKGGQDGGNRI